MLKTREQCVVLLLLLWQSNSNGACVHGKTETLDWSVSFWRRSEIFISKCSVSLGLCVWSINTMSPIVQWVCKQIQNTIVSNYQQLKHSPGWPWQSLAQVTFLLVESSVKQNTVFIQQSDHNKYGCRTWEAWWTYTDRSNILQGGSHRYSWGGGFGCRQGWSFGSWFWMTRSGLWKWTVRGSRYCCCHRHYVSGCHANLHAPGCKLQQYTIPMIRWSDYLYLHTNAPVTVMSKECEVEGW